MGVFVASDPEFTAQPTVANGVSDLFFEVLVKRPACSGRRGLSQFAFGHGS